MQLKVGDKVKYTFPLNVTKTINATIEFKGETVIYLMSEDGIKIKVRGVNFEYIEPFDNMGFIYSN